MATLRVENISKNYGKVEALKNVSFTCGKNDFVAILGSPGAGKTTLLKVLAGLEECKSGRIYYDGEDITDVDPRARNVSMAFESYALYPHLPVRENILHPLKVRGGHTEAQMKDRLEEVTAMLRITELMERKTNQLSGGQRQRVGLARALIRDNPRLLLLDEPIAHLDATLRHWLRGELKQYLKARNTTTIYSTPDYLEAMGMGDQVVVLSSGSVIQNSAPRLLFERPQNTEIAGLIGDPPINIVRVKVEGADGAPGISLGGARIPVPGKWRKLLESSRSDKVIIGLRPWDITISKQPSPNTVSGSVYVQEAMQRKKVFCIRVDGELIKVNTPLDTDYGLEERVWLGLDLEKALIYDAETELLIEE